MGSFALISSPNLRPYEAEDRTRSVEWEEPNCPFCARRNASKVVESDLQTECGRPVAVIRCRNCDLCYTSPRPTLSSLSYFYPGSYRPYQHSRSRGLTLLRAWRKTGNLRYVLPWQGQGRLLDFGCGGGAYLERLHRQGWQVTGLDLSAHAAQRVQQLGHKVMVGSLPHDALTPGSFDVITMWHSLEHVHEPLNVLCEARKLLAPAGKLVVAVPNIESLPFRWFRQHWFGLDLPRHLTHFSPRTLLMVLEAAGFRPGPVHHVRHSEWLRTSARMASGSPSTPFWKKCLTTKSAARLATWYSWCTHQSDCILVTAQG